MTHKKKYIVNQKYKIKLDSLKKKNTLFFNTQRLFSSNSKLSRLNSNYLALEILKQKKFSNNFLSKLSNKINFLSKKNKKDESFPQIYLQDKKHNFTYLNKDKNFFETLIFNIKNWNKIFYEKIRLTFNSKNFLLFRNLIIGVFALIAFSTTGFTLWYNVFATNTTGVVGEIKYEEKIENFEDYRKWIVQKNGEYSVSYFDLDKDDLTNYEEFLINSNPNNSHTCGNENNDSQNLFNLINPVDCQKIDENNLDYLSKISTIFNINSNHKNNKNENKNINSTEEEENKNTSLLNLFQVSSYEELENLSNNNISNQINKLDIENQLKLNYLKQISKIDNYIEKNRSYEIYDRDLPTPVNGSVYLDISLKYNVPLKYMLAVARLESRFGTDRYTNTGGLTRPGEYKNIYSMGLTDSGNNLNFSDWTQGVESFGKWYKKFNNIGISDCNKWKIYNPNGDYCLKVENLAKEIDYCLNKE